MRMRPDLLTGLTDAQARAVSALGTSRRVAPGDTIFTLGEPADTVFIIERGCVALTLPMQVREREEPVLLEERGPAQALGWSALTAPHTFTLTARALIETDVLALTRESLLAHLDAHPEVGYVVMRNVAAIVGQRLQVVRAMWLREMQRVVRLSHA